MNSFDNKMASAVDDAGKKGWLVAILELGAWFGVLNTGWLADKLSRKYTIVVGMLVFFSQREVLMEKISCCCVLCRCYRPDYRSGSFVYLWR
jgi:MFS family permease